MIPRFLFKCNQTSAIHRGLDTCCGGSCCIAQADLVLSRADSFENEENVSTYAADFSWPMQHPPCPFSFSVTTHLFAWMMHSHMKSPLSTAVFCYTEKGALGFLFALYSVVLFIILWFFQAHFTMRSDIKCLRTDNVMKTECNETWQTVNESPQSAERL